MNARQRRTRRRITPRTPGRLARRHQSGEGSFRIGTPGFSIYALTENASEMFIPDKRPEARCPLKGLVA